MGIFSLEGRSGLAKLKLAQELTVSLKFHAKLESPFAAYMEQWLGSSSKLKLLIGLLPSVSGLSAGD